jgi:xanthine dehydrogenase YagR molybdenum-binding subunit
MPTTLPTTPPPGKKRIKTQQVVNGVPHDVEIDVDDVPDLSWGDNSKHRLLNTKLPRADGPAKTTGTAIYTADVKLPGMLHGRFVCSPHAHAVVTGVDTAEAEKLPGVKAIIPFGREVRYEGEPVVAIAATTVEAAEDAVRAVVVNYDVKPHNVVADPKQTPAAAPGGRGGGGRGQRGGGDEPGTLAALEHCDAVVEAEYRTKIVHHCCLEPHGAVADYRGGDSADVYVSTQGCQSIAGDAARTLGIDESKVTGIVQNMGGGFGSKFGIGIAGQWACRLSKQLKSPVKMILTRKDEFLTAGNGPGSIQQFKAGANKDGTLVAVHCQQYALPGVGRANLGNQPYQYRAQHAFNNLVTLNTNEDSSVAMRAPGFPQACFAMESLMDELAYKIGMDPVEFRKKNATNDAHRRQLDRGAKAIGWANRNPTPGGGTGKLRRGMGCGIGAWGGGGRAQCVVTVSIGRDGSVTVACGSQDLGTGTRTYMRAIVAEELGLEMADVLEKIGNSKLGDANASGGSTTAASLAPAVKVAAVNARKALAKRIAALLGCAPEQVVFDIGKVIGDGKPLDWKQACAALPSAGLTVTGEWNAGLSGNGAHGASFAEVEVDMETGHIRPIKMCHVQDGGLILNRLAAESQINGGMIQSLGMALYEQRVMDSKLGIMLNSGFGDYKLAGCLEIPELIPIIDDEDPRNVVIGIAEPANIPGVGAVANAVFNACGVRVRDLPITPDKILNALAIKA